MLRTNDPTAGKTVGQPFQVSRFERPRLMVPRWISTMGLSLTHDKLVMTMAEESGSIWVLDNVDRWRSLLPTASTFPRSALERNAKPYTWSAATDDDFRGLGSGTRNHVSARFNP